MKKFFIPFLSFLALPSAIHANIDPKVAEKCMQASDFQGCVEIMAGQMFKVFVMNLLKPTSANKTILLSLWQIGHLRLPHLTSYGMTTLLFQSFKTLY